MADKRAVVLLSGGLDSATCLAIARREGFACHCLTVNYGQRHAAELAAAGRVAAALDAVEHRIVHLDIGQETRRAAPSVSSPPGGRTPQSGVFGGGILGGSALTDTRIAVPTGGVQPGIPVTYVPARNTIMLSLALGWAEVLGARDIYVGVNAVDYSGYPDCRPEFIRAFERMANLATKAAVEGHALGIHAPLLDLSKAEIVRRGMALGVDYALTVSCYQADEAGRACGLCDACRLRQAGFRAAGVADPTRYAYGQSR